MPRAALARRYEAGTWAEFPWVLQVLLATVAPLALLAFYSGADSAVMVGAMSGMDLGHFLNERFVRSGTRAPWPIQAVKTIGGVLVVLAVRVGLKALFPPGEVWDLFRYAAIGLAAAYLWPWLFTRFGGAFAVPAGRRVSG